MIRRSNLRTKWPRKKRFFLVGLLLWLCVLLICEYQLTHYVVSPHPKELDCGTHVSGCLDDVVLSPPSIDDVSEGDAGVYVPPEFLSALKNFRANLNITEGILGNVEQPASGFTDVIEVPGLGVPLPYNSNLSPASKEQWEACDQRDTDFTSNRDALCQAYLGNLNNMRYIKAMSSRLFLGRTIKFKVRYAHGIDAIVKVSQRNFYFEASSEYVAFLIDRKLNFSRIPTSVFVSLPLDYMQVATAHSAFFSQWVDRFIMNYNYTQKNFFPCNYPRKTKTSVAPLCAYVTVQLWMYDVHSAFSGFLALPYEYNSAFAHKYYIPGHHLWPPNSSRLRAIGDVLDRFIFDFIIGNTDRGMNNHNNFVYGGCTSKTVCKLPSKSHRIRGLAKYAFLDHGSSLYSYREPKDNPFFGDVERIPICRFRRSTYEAMRSYRFLLDSEYRFSFAERLQSVIPPPIFKLVPMTMIKKTEERLGKVLRIVERCLERYSTDVVFSLPAYWDIAIAEELNAANEFGESNDEVGDQYA